MSEISENISGASNIDIVKNETVETTEETQLIVETETEPETEMVIVEKGSLEIEKEEDEEDDQDSKQKTSMIFVKMRNHVV
jgi:hypothetical protein